MQLKEEGENGASTGQERSRHNVANALDKLALCNLNSNKSGPQHSDRLNQTGLSSTFKSIDLPPKEYEQQLQQYEADVRNHIKVEQ